MLGPRDHFQNRFAGGRAQGKGRLARTTVRARPAGAGPSAEVEQTPGANTGNCPQPANCLAGIIARPTRPPRPSGAWKTRVWSPSPRRFPSAILTRGKSFCPRNRWFLTRTSSGPLRKSSAACEGPSPRPGFSSCTGSPAAARRKSICRPSPAACDRAKARLCWCPKYR